MTGKSTRVSGIGDLKVVSTKNGVLESETDVEHIEEQFCYLLFKLLESHNLTDILSTTTCSIQEFLT